MRENDRRRHGLGVEGSKMRRGEKEKRGKEERERGGWEGKREERGGRGKVEAKWGGSEEEGRGEEGSKRGGVLQITIMNTLTMKKMKSAITLKTTIRRINITSLAP